MVESSVFPATLAQQQGWVIQLLSGVERIAPEHQLAGQQPDNLCGPYWVATLLRSHGFPNLTPEQVAQSANSVLPIGDPATWLPQGVPSRQDYSLALPETADLRAAGTSVQGLAAAVEGLSNYAYTVVPLRAEWTPDRLEALLQLCHNHPGWNAVPLCNLSTRPLWGSRLAVSQAIAYLSGEPITPPPPDWSVGHFLALAGTVTGKERSLLIACDTYPQFGWQGYHLQSAEALAQALNRGDGTEGGILLFVASGDREQVVQQAKLAGFTIELWDNGSPQHRLTSAMIAES
ncbi:MAG TPA: hypothetical protein V6C57_19435 [Coleofasciculaceae cyanobacterium]